jgi:exosortase
MPQMMLNLVQGLSNRTKLAILLALWATSFYPVYPGLLWSWFNHSNNSHGVLVPFITLYFIWQKRKDLRSAEISSSWWGMLILAVTLGFYLLGYLGGIALVMRLSLVSSICGLVLYVLGRQTFRILLFPLLFLFFMVPVPDSIETLIAFPLQLFATKVSAALIGFLSIPAYREGNMLYFAQTQLEVAEACSGIRSMISLTMLSVIFVYLTPRGWRVRIVILLSAIPIALAANILRVSGTGVLAHFFGSGVAVGFLHEFSGLAVFAFGIVILYLEYVLLSKLDERRGSRSRVDEKRQN